MLIVALSASSKFQSTLLQEERQESSIVTRQLLSISIHAPTRGATLLLSSCFSCYIFQSTLLQEERLLLRCLVCLANIISIHAPTRGATCTCQQCTVLIQLFQSTLLQEERRNTHPNPLLIYYFNPRSYKRSDCKNAQ